MASCLCLETLLAFRHGELPKDEADVAQLHLDTCPACARALETLRRVEHLAANHPFTDRGGRCPAAPAWEAYRAGELEPDTVEMLERHAAGCEACFGELVGAADARGAEAEHLDRVLMERMHAQAMKHLGRDAQGRASHTHSRSRTRLQRIAAVQRRRTMQSWGAPLAAAAGILILIVAGLLFTRTAPPAGPRPFTRDVAVNAPEPGPTPPSSFTQAPVPKQPVRPVEAPPKAGGPEPAPAFTHATPAATPTPPSVAPTTGSAPPLSAPAPTLAAGTPAPVVPAPSETPKPGTHALPPAFTAAPVEIRDPAGEFTLERAGKKDRVRAAVEVLASDRLAALKSSRFTLPDGAEICMNRGTGLRLERLDGGGVRIRLEAGEVYVDEPKGAAGAIVASRHAECRPLGTRFDVLDHGDRTTLTVFDGQVVMSNAGGSVTASADQQVTATATGVLPARPSDAKAAKQWWVGVSQGTSGTDPDTRAMLLIAQAEALGAAKQFVPAHEKFTVLKEFTTTQTYRDEAARVERLRAFLGGEVVLYASDFPRERIRGRWTGGTDPGAVGKFYLATLPNADYPSLKEVAAGKECAEADFFAPAGEEFTVWFRMHPGNKELPSNSDSYFVQFSDSLAERGDAAYRIGSEDVLSPNLFAKKKFTWGWARANRRLQDERNPAAGETAARIRFEKTGMHTLRITTREAGAWFDQIVLSSREFTEKAPGQLVADDETVVPKPALR